jgi:hypothetical protein
VGAEQTGRAILTYRAQVLALAEGVGDLVGGGCGVQLGGVVAAQRLTVAKADGVNVDVSEATERFAGSRPVVVERSEHDLALLLGGDVTGEQDSLGREVQGDAAVGVARSRQDAGADRVEDLVIVELAVNTRRRGVGDGAGDLGVEPSSV